LISAAYHSRAGRNLVICHFRESGNLDKK
jgi:hypothetical protein